MAAKIEKIRLWHPGGREHFVNVAFDLPNQGVAALGAYYEAGNCAEIEADKQIAFWCASYEPPIFGNGGQAQLGNGRIDLEIEALRGIGLGSLLMRPLVLWIKSHAATVPVVPINLAADDAATTQTRDVRNRFYEKLGFKFAYRDNDTWGESIPMCSSALIVPPFQLSGGWKVESVDGSGGIF
jgi:GNAT superfamily N-acetyltransferase